MAIEFGGLGLYIILWWAFSGVCGWLAGFLIDIMLYDVKKFPWGILPLSIFIGPVTWVICFKAILESYLDFRKKNNGDKSG